MDVLGISGSPRVHGNSDFLLSVFLDEMAQKGHDTRVIRPATLKINPCIGCGHCETKGVCVFTDDFSETVLPAIIRADVTVLASPVYFYGFPAVLKALVDRIQVLWSRKYRLKTGEFKGRERKGVLLAAGATRGKDLFDGLKLTARYFFDAADIRFEYDLCYRGVDEKGAMERRPGVHDEVKRLADEI